LFAKSNFLDKTRRIFVSFSMPFNLGAAANRELMLSFRNAHGVAAVPCRMPIIAGRSWPGTSRRLNQLWMPVLQVVPRMVMHCGEGTNALGATLNSQSPIRVLCSMMRLSELWQQLQALTARPF
jgi:hypothetical protein